MRLIDSDGSQLGIMPSKKAMELAEQKNLDLVKIAPGATPPVCKIIDYGKYRFEQSKREKEQRKNQRVVDIKEVRLSLNIDIHDFETKKNHAARFISEGNKVKASIRFRGREMGHPELGQEIMHRFAEAMAEVANVERQPKLEGRNMFMFLVPKPVKSSIRFRGREMGHPELGQEIMTRFAEAMAEVANVERQPKLEGRTMLMFLVPKPAK